MKPGIYKGEFRRPPVATLIKLYYTFVTDDLLLSDFWWDRRPCGLYDIGFTLSERNRDPRHYKKCGWLDRLRLWWLTTRCRRGRE